MMNAIAEHKKTPRVGQRGYTMLLLALMALWLIGPVFDLFGLEEAGEVILISIALVAAADVMRGKGVRFFLVVGMGVCLGIMLWIHLSSPLARGAYIGMTLVGALFFGAVAAELLLAILAPHHKVTMSLIHGAIAVYLLIGVCFSFIYLSVFAIDPTAFRGVEGTTAAFNQFLYFSVVTLTTLGYGDVTPVTRIGGSFATMEATLGQIYLTVLVARLVGMQISQQTAD
jgi:hypothetical protein